MVRFRIRATRALCAAATPDHGKQTSTTAKHEDRKKKKARGHPGPWPDVQGKNTKALNKGATQGRQLKKELHNTSKGPKRHRSKWHKLMSQSNATGDEADRWTIRRPPWPTALVVDKEQSEPA